MLNLQKRVQFDRYPAFSHEAYHFDEFLKTYLDLKPTKRIQATSRIVTFGSCFADNFARYLQERGVHAFNAWIGENFNSPMTNFRMLTSKYRFDESTGKYCLADESQRIISKALDEQKLFYHLFGQMRESLRRADFLVMTVGNSLCARDSEGRIYPYLEGFIAGVKHELMQVDEVVQFLHGTIDEVLNINPNIHIIITLSPIAIHGALGMNPILADCISKSNNRIAIHRVIEMFDPISLTYFPSFEIIRWLAPLSCSLRWSGPTHPSDDMLDSVMKLFFSEYTDVAF